MSFRQIIRRFLHHDAATVENRGGVTSSRPATLAQSAAAAGSISVPVMFEKKPHGTGLVDEGHGIINSMHEKAGAASSPDESENSQNEFVTAGNRPVRVLIIAPSLDILGGQAVQASRLVCQLSQESSLKVSFLPINPRLPGFFRKLQEIKYIRTIVTTLLYLTTLLIHVRKCDVVHIFSASYFSFLLAPTPAILVARLYDKKIVLNYRSGEAEDHLRRWPRSVVLWLISLAHEVAVPSRFLVKVFASFGLHARAIFNFVEPRQFSFRKRHPLRPIFLSNRNLEPLYNVGCILRAFAIIQERFPGARLTIAGDGSQRKELERLTRELRLRNTEFVGRVAPQNMKDLYDAADIYLNSSNIDNMPGSIIESFASGLPVITTDAGGIPYIVTDHQSGLLVARDDHRAMAALAIELLDNEDLSSRLISRAHLECRKYSWTAVREQWLNLYHDLSEEAVGSNDQVVSDQVVDESAPLSQR
jgi:glycosyltransferase involved in cell wall biosynthesis